MSKQQAQATPAQGTGVVNSENNQPQSNHQQQPQSESNNDASKVQNQSPADANSNEPGKGADITDKGDQSVGNDAPQWAKDLKQSNDDVIASNQEIVKAVEGFAKQVVSELRKVTNPQGNNQVSAQPAEVDKEGFDEDAEYIVSKGARFRDADDVKAYYSEGDDVTHMGAEKLKKAYNMGLIEEK